MASASPAPALATTARRSPRGNEQIEPAEACRRFAKVLGRRETDARRRDAKRAADAAAAATQAAQAHAALDAQLTARPLLVDLTYFDNYRVSDPYTLDRGPLNEIRYLAESCVYAPLDDDDDDADKVEAAIRAQMENSAAVRPVIEGRGAVTGTVLGTKSVENAYGYSFKLLMQDDRGFKLWGTCPRGLDADPENPGHWIELRGHRVEMVATVEAGRDFGFGFYSRPTKARLLD